MRLKLTLIALLLLLVTAGHAQQDGFSDFNAVFPKPYGYGGVFVRLGWFDTTQAWFISHATNNINFTSGPAFEGLATLAPKLSSALVPRVMGGDIAARPVYLVTNFQNPPVFSAAPRQPLYSALWQVFYVTWKQGVTPRPITSADPESPANPTGIPDASEADIVATQVVMDWPILALGPLGSPSYIIRQAAGSFVNLHSKILFLPAWLTYCQDPATKRVTRGVVQITDVADPALAAVLGANLAPGLLNMPDSDTSDFFVMREPKPLTQLPVVSDCPTGAGARNTNFDYSPVMRYVILGRNIPPYALVKSIDYLRLLLTSGGLVDLKDDQRINASTGLFDPE